MNRRLGPLSRRPGSRTSTSSGGQVARGTKLYALSGFSPTSYYQTEPGGGEAGMSNTWGFAVVYYVRRLPTALERVFGRANDVDKGWRLVVDESAQVRVYLTAGSGAQVSTPPWQLALSDVGKVHAIVLDKVAGGFYGYINRQALGGVSMSSYTGHNGPTLIGASEGGISPAQSIDVLVALTFEGNPTEEEVYAFFDATRRGEPLNDMPGATLRERWAVKDVLSEPVVDGQLAPASLPETRLGMPRDLMVREGSPSVRVLQPVVWAWEAGGLGTKQTAGRIGEAGGKNHGQETQ